MGAHKRKATDADERAAVQFTRLDRFVELLDERMNGYAVLGDSENSDIYWALGGVVRAMRDYPGDAGLVGELATHHLNTLERRMAGEADHV